jgi:hypothetical protein
MLERAVGGREENVAAAVKRAVLVRVERVCGHCGRGGQGEARILKRCETFFSIGWPGYDVMITFF